MEQQQIQKIRLFENRDFSKNFDTTFAFLKQNYLQILKGVAIIIPILLIANYFMPNVSSMSIEDISNMDNPMEFYMQFFNLGTIIGYFSLIICSFLTSLFCVCYIALYSESVDGTVDNSKVWSRVFSCILPIFLASILLSILVTVGTILCIIPGIIIYVYLTFYMYAYVTENTGIVECLQRSYELVKGNWWITLGYIIVFGIIIGVINFVFSIPSLLVSFGQLLGNDFFTSDVFVYIANTLGSLGYVILYPILYIALGVMYFSLRSQHENVDINEEIDAIGNDY